MKKLINRQSVFIIGAIIIGFLLNRTNCTSDPDCEPDPLYGGCPSSCDYGSIVQWVAKSFGIWFLLNLGATFEKENLKKKENLKEFLNSEGLGYTIREINEEWKVENEKSDKEFKKLLKSMESKK